MGTSNSPELTILADSNTFCNSTLVANKLWLAITNQIYKIHRNIKHKLMVKSQGVQRHVSLVNLETPFNTAKLLSI